MKEVIFNVNSANKVKNSFTKFLKKFHFFDKSILLKIDNGIILATMTNTEKSVIKFADAQIEEFANELEKPIFVPLMVSEKIVKSLEFFNDEPIQMKIIYDEIDGKNIALAIKFDSDTLNLELPCNKISFFQTSMQINSGVFDNLTDVTTKQYEIELSASHIEQIKSLAEMSDDEKLLINSSENGVEFINSKKTFNFKLSNNPSMQKQYGFLKNNIKVLDPDSYILYMKDSSAVLKSTTNNTVIIIAEIIS